MKVLKRDTKRSACNAHQLDANKLGVGSMERKILQANTKKKTKALDRHLIIKSLVDWKGKEEEVEQGDIQMKRRR